MSEALPHRAPLNSPSPAATDPNVASLEAGCDPTGAISFFDSLTHITADGSWLGNTRRDARRERLLTELEQCAPARACLVAIAGVIANEIVLDTARQHPEQFVPIGSINPG